MFGLIVHSSFRLFAMRLLPLLAALCLAPPASAQFDLVPLTPNQVAEGAFFGNAVALSADGTTALVGAFSDDGGEDTPAGYGAAYVFVRTPDGWVEQAKLTAPTQVPQAHFGSAVALAAGGDLALIGASFEGDPSRGAAYVYAREGGAWAFQARLAVADAGDYVYFGEAVALSANGATALVGAGGAQNADGSRGAAFAFTRSGGAWQRQAWLTGEPDAFGLGGAVALSSDGATALVGVTGIGSVGGSPPPSASYVFRRTGTDWTREARLQSDDATEAFGLAVALSPDGDLAVVGDPVAASSTGRAHVYRRGDGAWMAAPPPLAPTGAPPFFGASVSLSAEVATGGTGGRLLVGAPGGNPAGAVFLYTRDADGWRLGSGFSDPDGGTGEAFGASAALAADGSTFVVGDYGEDEPFRSAGAAYIATSQPVDAEPSVEDISAALSPPWPNPTAGAARVTLLVPTPQRVEVAVYDRLGRRLAVLHDAPLPAAAHELSLARSLSPGVYVVRARGETFTATQRLTIVR